MQIIFCDDDDEIKDKDGWMDGWVSVINFVFNRVPGWSTKVADWCRSRRCT